MINDFKVHALTGMFITFMASFANLGLQLSFQTWLCGIFGWKLCSLVGAGIQFIILLLMPRFYDWVQDGDAHVPELIREEEEDEDLVGQWQPGRL
jgi:hypothetical protein